MPSMAVTRPLVRQSGALSRMAARRFESSASAKAAEATKETAAKSFETVKSSAAKASETAQGSASQASANASEYTSKATQGLSKVTSAAGPAISGAAKGLASSLGKVGGRTGKFIGFVERQVPHVVYYSKVGLELGKIIVRGQKMSPPSVQTIQTYWQRAVKTVRNPSALLQTASETASKASQQPSSILQQARNLSRAQIVAGGVVAAECLGFFTFGEMIGRFKVIGYHGENSAHH